MRAGRLARYMDAVRIAAEALGIVVDPGDSAPYLIGATIDFAGNDTTVMSCDPAKNFPAADITR